MKRYFITSKKDTPLKKLLTDNLKNTDADSLIEAGSCWLEKKRLSDKNQIILAKTTVKVFINETNLTKHILIKEHIIYEDNKILVVFKPEKLNVQSDFSSTQNNLTFLVKQYLNKCKINYDPTPINRLDLNVSGLVLFAKNKDTEKKLFELSRERKIYKQYTAFLENKVNQQNIMTVQDRLIFRKSKAHQDLAGKTAKTKFHKIKKYENFTKYSVFLYTGRRHQIRIHAATYIGAIVGDKKYGSKIKNKQITLTSCGLNFKLNNKKYRIRLPDQLIKVPTSI